MRLTPLLLALLPACASSSAPPAGGAGPASSSTPAATVAPATTAAATPAATAPASAAASGPAACVGPGVRVDFLDEKSRCCAGLSPLGDLPPGPGGVCLTPPPGPAIGQCWPSCGNKKCEAPAENRCNCPADCR